MSLKRKLILSVCCFFMLNCSAKTNSPPRFTNSIVSTEFDFITAEDPSTFIALKFLGQDTKEMPDKRHDDLFANDTFIFEASFNDDLKVEIWAHNSFGSIEVAQRYSQMLTGPLGKLPTIMLKKLSHVVLHKGNETALAEHIGHFFVIYSENMEIRIGNHDLEETVFHESVHATLDLKHAESRPWRSAQKSDDAFITEYSKENPKGEDLAESAIFAYTMLKHPGRLPSDVELWIHKQIPNRIALLEEIFSE